MCAYGNRQHFCTDGRVNSHWLRSVFQTWACFHSSHNNRQRHCCTGWLNALALQQPTLPLRYHVEQIWVWVVLLSHPLLPTVVGTGVLWVLTGTHPCDDPPRHDGDPSKRQLVLCVIARVCVVVLLCGRHVRGE